MSKSLGIKYQGKNNNNNTRFVERRGAIASDALVDRSSHSQKQKRKDEF